MMATGLKRGRVLMLPRHLWGEMDVAPEEKPGGAGLVPVTVMCVWDNDDVTFKYHAPNGKAVYLCWPAAILEKGDAS